MPLLRAFSQRGSRHQGRSSRDRETSPCPLPRRFVTTSSVYAATDNKTRPTLTYQKTQFSRFFKVPLINPATRDMAFCEQPFLTLSLSSSLRSVFPRILGFSSCIFSAFWARGKLHILLLADNVTFHFCSSQTTSRCIFCPQTTSRYISVRRQRHVPFLQSADKLKCHAPFLLFADKCHARKFPSIHAPCRA